MIDLPPVISRDSLRDLFAPDETHVVRVIAHDVHNPTVYRFRCHSREYLFEMDGALQKHVLDIPLSVWMKGIDPRGQWAGNASVCEDFRTSERSPWTLQVVRIADEAPAAAPAPDYLPELRRLLSGLGAPESVQVAFGLIEMEVPVAELAAHVDQSLAVVSNQPTETAKERNARRMREKRAAEKAALQTA